MRKSTLLHIRSLLRTYVDDIISGIHSEEERNSATDDLQLSLVKGGFSLKGFSFSGSDPDTNRSADGKLVVVGGLKWITKEDISCSILVN